MIDLPERLYDQLKNVAIANALAAEAYGFIDEYK
jgi:hypothetical protein